MKKTLLLTGLIATLGVAGLVGCASTKKGAVVLTRDQSLSMQAATSLNMIGGVNGNSIRHLRKLAKAAEENNDLTDAEVADIIKVLPTLDLMLENGTNGFDSSIEDGEFTPVEGKDTYNTKETITFRKAGLDELETYTLYYSVVKPVEPETPVVPEDTAPKAQKEDEEAEVETVESIAGIATTNGTDYLPFESIVENEVDAEETEETRTFKINTAETSYIEVAQEHEIDLETGEAETEFAYKVVENGLTTLEYSIEIENEDNQLEIGYEIGNIEYELVKEVKDAETIYHVEFENEDTDVEALVSFRKETDEEGNSKFVRI